MESIGYYVSCLKNGVKNLITWFPIIWKDRQWSEHYIYIILLKKVENKIKFFHSDNCYSAHSDEVVEQLMVVKESLERLINDPYYEEACAIYNYKPYDFENTPVEIKKGIWDLEDQLRNKDIQSVFSEEISNQIERWWD